MYISEDNLKSYLNSILNLMENDGTDLKEFHNNMILLESISNELDSYSEVINYSILLDLIAEVKDLVLHYLENRYTVLMDRKLRKSINKRIKTLKYEINSFTLEDCSINMGYIKNNIDNVLKEIYTGTDIRNYGDVISKYTKLNNSLKSLDNIVNSTDIIDDEMHFLDTFLDRRFLYLGAKKIGVL